MFAEKIKMYWQKYKLCWLATAILIFCLLLIWGKVVPLYKEVNSLSQQWSDDLLWRKNQKIALNDFASWREIAKKSLASEKILKSNLFTDDKLISLVDEIEKMATETGNEVEVSVPDNPNKKKKKLERPKEFKKEYAKETENNDNGFALKIILRGDFLSLWKFIDSLPRLSVYNEVYSWQTTKRSAKRKTLSDGLPIRNVYRTDKNNPFPVEKQTNVKNDILETKLKLIFYCSGECRVSKR